jgi:hypothetical protein
VVSLVIKAYKIYSLFLAPDVLYFGRGEVILAWRKLDTNGLERMN